MTPRVSRRAFLGSSAAAVLAASSAFSADPPAHAPVRVAFIGVNGKGKANLKGVSDAGGAIAVLCDVDRRNLDEARRTWPQARPYQDFRAMLQAEKDNIDAVVVTTPDHTHLVAALAAVRLGKHVYCEKPLTHDIAEARLLRSEAAKAGVATQMGNGAHSSNWLRQDVEWLRAGCLGAVQEVHVWTNRPIWPQGMHAPAREEPVPPGLDWDAWVGPAPMRPYSSAYAPFKWRGWWDFGTGALGDMACHLMDPAVWALDLTGSCGVEAQSEGATEQSPPLWSTITYHFPAKAQRGPVRMTWYDGKKNQALNLPAMPEGLSQKVWEKNKDGGMYVVGDKGSAMLAWGSAPILLGAARGFKPPPPSLPRSKSHYGEWLNACQGGPAALSNFDYAAGLTETVLVGNLALRLGGNIQWDAQRMQVIGKPQADALIQRRYRPGWEVAP